LDKQIYYFGLSKYRVGVAFGFLNIAKTDVNMD